MKQLLSRPDYVCTAVHVDLVTGFFSLGLPALTLLTRLRQADSVQSCQKTPHHQT